MNKPLCDGYPARIRKLTQLSCKEGLQRKLLPEYAVCCNVRVMQKRSDCHAKSTTESSFPRRIKRGGGEAVIYEVNNRDQKMYQVACWIAGKRERRTFKRYADAWSHAEAQANAINTGRLSVARMNDSDREAFVHAEREMKEIGLPLLDGVRLLVAAVKELKGTGSLVQAARDYAEAHSAKLKEMTVRDVVAAFMANKRATPGLDHRYVTNLDKDLKRIATAFPKPISSLTAEDAQNWIRRQRTRSGEPLGWKRQNGFRSLLVELAQFARDKKKALPPGPVALLNIDTLKRQHKEIGTLTPDEMQKLLHAAIEHNETEKLLYYCIAGFAGLRPVDETLSLDWSDVDLVRAYIRVRAHKSKTSMKRHPKMSENLRAWLAPHAKKSGPVFTENADERARYFAKNTAKVTIPFDGLRHSYGTYRVAVTSDIEAVAHEMGNSWRIVKRDYDRVAMKEEGEAWFAIMPPVISSNVVTISSAA
jgi:integrase